MTPDEIAEQARSSPQVGTVGRAATDAHPATEPWPSDDISLSKLAAIVARHRGIALRVAIPVAVLGVAYVFLSALTPTFTSTASFVPQRSNGSSNLSGLAGIAAQYGVSLKDDSGESPEFYETLLRSRRLLTAVVESPYTFQDGDRVRNGSLVELYGGKKKSKAIAKEAALKQLNRDVQVNVARTTGVVSLSVKAEDPQLARQIAERIVDQVHMYNRSTRQSKAAAERNFIEERLRQKRTELARAESRLEDFLSRNRQFENSPQLSFAHDRLERDVALQQQVVGSLTESFEEARIEEVRNTPVITLIETPEIPVLPNPRGRIKKTLFVLFFSGLAGISAALMVAWLRNGGLVPPATDRPFDSDLRQMHEPSPAGRREKKSRLAK